MPGTTIMVVHECGSRHTTNSHDFASVLAPVLSKTLSLHGLAAELVCSPLRSADVGGKNSLVAGHDRVRGRFGGHLGRNRMDGLATQLSAGSGKAVSAP